MIDEANKINNFFYINKIDNIINITLDKYYIELKKKEYTEKYIISNFSKIKEEMESILKYIIKNNNDFKEDDKILKVIIYLLEKYILIYFLLYISNKLDLKIILSIINKLYNKYLSKIKNNEYINKYNKYYNNFKDCYNILNYIKEHNKLLEGVDKITLEFINKILEDIELSKLINDHAHIKLIFDNLEVSTIEIIISNKDSIIHNILKLIIFKSIYIKEDRKNILKICQIQDNSRAKYKYIEIVDSKYNDIEYSNIEIMFNQKEIRIGLAEEMYNMLLDYEMDDKIDYTIDEKINILFEKKILIPITEDFLRYHKSTELYEVDTTKIDKEEITTKKFNTKIRYIINRINNIKDYYSQKKNNVENLFFKQLIYRKAVLINDLEEINILRKIELQGSIIMENNEFYSNLMQIRMYPYIEFHNSSKDNIIYKPRKLINAIRYCNIEYKDLIEYENIRRNIIDERIINDNMTVNIVGIAITRYNLIDIYNDPIACHTIEDLIDINKIFNIKKINGFKAILSKLSDIFIKNKKYSKYIYWLFNKDVDKIKLKLFNNMEELSTNEYFKLLLGLIYDKMVDITYMIILKQLNIFEYIDVIQSKKIIKDIENKLVLIPNKSIEYANLMKYIYYEKSKINISRYDTLENKILRIDKIIKLPRVYLEKFKIHIIKIQKKDLVVYDNYNIDYDNAICQHIVTWNNFIKYKKVNINKFNQELYNFIKRYVTENSENDFICKSCYQLVDLKQYTTDIYPGSDSISVSYGLQIELENIIEYSKYAKSIKNIDKIIEQITNSANLTYYVGSSIDIKLRRHEIIKNIIDLIDIQYKTLFIKDQKKRKEQNDKFIKIYGCNLSNFFLFKLENDIFTYSSKEKDKFKLYKLNNILTYILINIITEINLSQIIYLSDDKLINYFLFEKFGYTLFNNLYIKISNKDDIVAIKNYKLLCYVVYYISGIFIKYNMWYVEGIENKSNIINLQIQRIIIHTFIGCINSILEANINSNNYIYNNFSIKFFNKLYLMYDDSKVKDVIDKLQNLNKKKITIIDNKLKYKTSKIEPIPLRSYNYSKNNIVLSNLGTNKILLYSSNYFIYNELKKSKIEDIISIEELNKINDRLYNETLIKIASLYSENGIKRTIVLQYEDIKKNYTLDKLKEIYNKTREIRLKNYSIVNKEKLIEKNNFVKDLINEFKEHLLDQIIEKFIEKLNNIIGKNININNNNYYLLENVYILDHNYKGNKINNIYILENENKIKIRKNDSYFKQDVYYYEDNINQIIVYYSKINNYLIGYRDNDKKYIKIYNSNCYIKINYSIYNQLKLFGFNYLYYKIDYRYKITNYIDYINNILMNRLKNLKNSISEIQIILYQIIYKFEGSRIHKIAKYYQNKLKEINIYNNNNKIFDSWNDISKLKYNKINIESEYTTILLNNNIYIDSNTMLNYLTNDNVVLYYIIREFNLLLDINNNNYIKVNLAYLIINIILELFNNFMINEFAFYNLNVKTFYELIINKLDEYKQIDTNEIDISKMSEDELEKYKENIDMDIEADNALDVSTDDANEDFGDEDFTLVNKNSDDY